MHCHRNSPGQNRARHQAPPQAAQTWTEAKDPNGCERLNKCTVNVTPRIVEIELQLLKVVRIRFAQTNDPWLRAYEQQLFRRSGAFTLHEPNSSAAFGHRQHVSGQ